MHQSKLAHRKLQTPTDRWNYITIIIICKYFPEKKRLPQYVTALFTSNTKGLKVWLTYSAQFNNNINLPLRNFSVVVIFFEKYVLKKVLQHSWFFKNQWYNGYIQIASTHYGLVIKWVSGGKQVAVKWQPNDNHLVMDWCWFYFEKGR